MDPTKQNLNTKQTFNLPSFLIIIAGKLILTDLMKTQPHVELQLALHLPLQEKLLQIIEKRGRIWANHHRPENVCLSLTELIKKYLEKTASTYEAE